VNWVLDNLDLIVELALVHVRQSVPPLVFGLLVSLPLGWLAWRYRAARGTILSITGLLYTIPSLALLFILPVVFGISATSEANLITALTIYAVALLTRSVAEGLASVDPDVRLAATAVGYGTARRFWAVDLPLSGPVILAGLRVTAASTVALATVGILIGVTNLGYLFTNGLQRRIIPEVVAGLVAVGLIALLIDLALVLLGRLLMPWTRRTATSRISAQREVVRAEVTA